MNAIFTKFRVSMLAGAIALGSASAPVFAVEDVLVTPSIHAVKASKSLLLDIVEVGGRFVAVGARGHILFSDDSGASWTQANVPVSVLLTSIVFSDNENGWAVGHSGVILHSTDRGASWVKQFDGNAANKMIITQSENVVSALQSRLESATEDEMEDLEYEIEEAEFALEDSRFDAEIGASKPLLDIVFIDSDSGFVVGAYGFIFKTTDKGVNWTNYGAKMNNPDRFHLNSIALIDGNVLLIVGEAGVIFRSEDMGETWASIDSPYGGSFFGLTETGEKRVVLAFGLRGNLYRSTDAGLTWDAIDSHTQSTLIAGEHNGQGNISIVGNSGSIIFSDDGGRTFKETIRNDRLGVASIVFNRQNQLVVVGEAGINLTNSAGLNL